LLLLFFVKLSSVAALFDFTTNLTLERTKPMKKVMLQGGGTLVVAALTSVGMLMPQAVMSAEPVYSVVSPLGEQTVKMLEMAPRLDSLANKTVCMVSNNSFKVNVTHPAIEKALKEKYPGIKIVPYSEMPRAYSRASWDAMPGEFRRKGCDAVISGNGG